MMSKHSTCCASELFTYCHLDFNDFLMCVNAKQLIPLTVSFNCCGLTHRISHYRNISLQGSWQNRWGEVPNVKTERINTEDVLRPVKAFQLDTSTSAFEHKTSSNSAKGPARCRGGEHCSWLHYQTRQSKHRIPTPSTSRGQASTGINHWFQIWRWTSFGSFREFPASLHPPPALAVFPSERHCCATSVLLRWVLVDGMQLPGRYAFICNPIS